MSAAVLVDRLEGVRQMGKARWLAKCPAHQDRNPSLSIRETSDGTTLIKCFAGCGAAAVLAAVGLEFKDLFPADWPDKTKHRFRPSRSRVPAGDILRLLEHEVTVASIIAADLLAEKSITEAQWGRLAQAAARIWSARHG